LRGRWTLEASTKYFQKPLESPAQTWIEWKIDRSVVLVAAVYLSPIGLVHLAIMGGTGTILSWGEDGCWKLQNKKHGWHRHKLGLSGIWIEVVALVAVVYLSPLALCTSWQPSWEAPAQSWVEGKMDFGSLNNILFVFKGRHPHKFGLSGRWIEVVVLVAAAYLSP
jgi:hypothetical protein